MANLAATMSKIQEITEMNLSLLNLINDSLYSNAEHVTATINGTNYSIPSFIYIENELTNLKSNWNRLVDAPYTGQASFAFDGQTKRIFVQGFENAPMSVNPQKDDIFYVENNDVLKDFMTPLIYLKYNLSDVPEHIKEVSIRKIAIMNEQLANRLSGLESKKWIDVNGIISAYTEDVDYIMYDTVYRMPIKHSDYEGVYKVIDVDQKDDVIVTLTLDNIKYTYNDGTLSRMLDINDYLITEHDECKLIVKSINTSDNTVTCKYISGYKRIYKGDTLKFLRNQERYPDQKYIKVPLEEDKYVMLFMSVINSELNLRSSWSEGQFINTDELTDVNGNKFREVYNSRIRNIGDILNDITRFNTTTLSNIGDIELKKLTEYKPSFNEDDYSVVLLNEHILDNSSVEHLRKLNIQKAQIENELNSIQNNINEVNEKLTTYDYSQQNSAIRADLETALASYNTKRDGFVKDLNHIINQITIESTSTSLPTTGSKYVISGGIRYKDIEDNFKDTSRAKVIRMELLYRYKNINKEASSAAAISEVITVSDWNKYIVDYRQKEARYQNNQMVYVFEDSNDDSTTSRWSTFQIPITQGESVDMRFRVQYDLGYPYVSTFSGWSDVVNVEFPADLIKNEDIASIIEKNENDSKLAAVESELISKGIINHIEDKQIDQELTYMHKADSIASGFFTEDTRRVISVYEKLKEMANQIGELRSGAFGGNFRDLTVRIESDFGTISNLVPNSPDTTINIPDYTSLSKAASTEVGAKSAIVTIYIINSSQDSPIYLYSMYPGDKSELIDDRKSSMNSKWYASVGSYEGVKMRVMNDVDSNSIADGQYCSQVVYFRSKDKFSNKVYKYGADVNPNETITMSVCPYILNIRDIQTETTTPGDYIKLNAGESIAVPLYVTTKLPAGGYAKTDVSFDVWSSPFMEPTTYSFTIVSRYENNDEDVINQINNNGTGTKVINSTVTKRGGGSAVRNTAVMIEDTLFSREALETNRVSVGSDRITRAR